MGRRDISRQCCYCASPMQEHDSFCPECGRLQTVIPLSQTVDAAGPEPEADSPIRPAPPLQTPVEPDPQWFVDLSNAPLAPLDYKFPEPPDEDPTLADPLAETKRFEVPKPEQAAAPAPPEELPHLAYPGRLYANAAPEGGAAARAVPAAERELPGDVPEPWRQTKLIVGLALALLSLVLLVLAGIMIYRAMVKFPAPAAAAPGRQQLLRVTESMPQRGISS
ncbi:MAG: hypothetical protein QM270_07420 [Bacillota bacterium]|nr:hypothetical protein [Bacillota bacterium]